MFSHLDSFIMLHIISIHFTVAAARKRGELHTDLTAIVTLSRGCEALQQKVDDYYRQVSSIALCYVLFSSLIGSCDNLYDTLLSFTISYLFFITSLTFSFSSFLVTILFNFSYFFSSITIYVDLLKIRS